MRIDADDIVDGKLIIPENTLILQEGCLELSWRLVKEVFLPKSLVSIESFVFNSCENLEKVIFAKDSNIQFIGEYAFENCPSLTIFEINSNNDIHFGRGVFENSGSDRSSLDLKNTKMLTVPEKMFRNSCFINIVLPETVVVVKDSAFENSKIDNISLPNVLEIKSNAFSGCELKKIEINPYVSEINIKAFQNCKQSEEVKKTINNLLFKNE